MKILDHAMAVIDRRNGITPATWELVRAVRSILDNQQMTAAAKLRAIDRLTSPAIS